MRTLKTGRHWPGSGKTIPGVEATFAQPGKNKNMWSLWLGEERIDYDRLKKSDFELDILTSRPGWDYYLRTIQIINRFGQDRRDWPDIDNRDFREWLRRQMNWLYKPGVMISFGTRITKRGWFLSWFGGVCASGLTCANQIEIYPAASLYKNRPWYQVKTIPGVSQFVAPDPFRYNRQETPTKVHGTNGVNWRQVPTITQYGPLSIWDGVAIPAVCFGPAWVPGEILA